MIADLLAAQDRVGRGVAGMDVTDDKQHSQGDAGRDKDVSSVWPPAER